jgi:hypothetical protein
VLVSDGVRRPIVELREQRSAVVDLAEARAVRLLLQHREVVSDDRLDLTLRPCTASLARALIAGNARDSNRAPYFNSATSDGLAIWRVSQQAPR